VKLCLEIVYVRVLIYLWRETWRLHDRSHQNCRQIYPFILRVVFDEITKLRL